MSIFFSYYTCQDLSKMLKHLHFGTIGEKLWLFKGTFGTIFDENSSQLQKFFSRKQKITLLYNFDHWFSTHWRVFLQNLKKIKNAVHFQIWPWKLMIFYWITGHPVYICPKYFLVIIFFGFFLPRPFQNAQTLAFWFSGWRVMTI